MLIFNIELNCSNNSYLWNKLYVKKYEINSYALNFQRTKLKIITKIKYMLNIYNSIITKSLLYSSIVFRLKIKLSHCVQNLYVCFADYRYLYSEDMRNRSDEYDQDTNHIQFHR